MKPMEIKEPTECCSSPSLLWSREQQYYVCPCGKFRVNDQGFPVRHPWNRGFGYGKKTNPRRVH